MAGRPGPSSAIKVGEKFGRLEVIGPCERDKHGLPVYLVRCECGKEKRIRGQAMISGHAQSCGCLHRERASANMSQLLFKHGDSAGGEGKRLYDIWRNMKKRCDSPTYPEYHLYGGRGIKYVPEWSEFERFKEWALSIGYRDDLTIERKEVNGNYSPSNCMFVPKIHQAQNRRKRQEKIPASSQYKGVSGTELHWTSYICHQGTQIFLGHYDSEHAAGHAYNEASKILFNEWAAKNDIPPDVLSPGRKEAIKTDVIRRISSKLGIAS